MVSGFPRRQKLQLPAAAMTAARAEIMACRAPICASHINVHPAPSKSTGTRDANTHAHTYTSTNVAPYICLEKEVSCHLSWSDGSPDHRKGITTTYSPCFRVRANSFVNWNKSVYARYSIYVNNSTSQQIKTSVIVSLIACARLSTGVNFFGLKLAKRGNTRYTMLPRFI